jgi:hypothetical protein
MTPSAAVLLAAAALAAPATATAAVDRERHRLAVAPGATQTVWKSAAADDRVEIGVRYPNGRWLPFKPFPGGGLVWWRPRFTASAVSITPTRIRVVVTNTSRRTLRLRVVFDTL